jgi:ABC-type transporter Mla subunit MlaD
LAAGQDILTTVQNIQNLINPTINALQAQETASIEQVQAAANTISQNITSQVQAAMNSTQQLSSTLGNTSKQVQACLAQKIAALSAIAQVSRK